MELCDHTAAQLCTMLNKGELSSKEITESVFQRIDQREKDINAYISVFRKQALHQAESADKKFHKKQHSSRLNGIPIAFKDNVCTRGLTTTCGSNILKNYLPPYDATAVKKVYKDGMVGIGKTNMDEFGMGSSTENSIAGPTRNPVNTEYVAGGSSGGSAAAVAAGETVLALGTDTGRSVRQPAAFCGVVGIKPTYGRVSRYGLISYASSLDQIGVLGRTVEDCAILLQTICGPDRNDSTSADILKIDFLSSLNNNIKGLKIGMPREYFSKGLDGKIKDSVLHAAQLLQENGAEIVDISLPHTDYAISAYYLIATAEASSNLARYDGVQYGLRAKNNYTDIKEMYENTRYQGFSKEVKRRIMLGTYVLSAGHYQTYYLKAQKARTLIKHDFDQAFKKVDVIISPVTPTLPFKQGEKIYDPLKMYLMDIYTVPLNLAGLPGMSVPCGTIDELPAGFQIIGKPFDEKTVLRTGHLYQQITGK
ncbi:MAG: Asp-tRNA(Asn)/Glu-tRNA(Gln) amidotransferase subunit GatA [bacterium]